MKRKEQRWTSSTTRLRDRIETLETENSQLKEEIRLLERKRLEAWQQKEAEKKSAKAAVTSNPLLKVCVMFSMEHCMLIRHVLQERYTTIYFISQKEDSRKNALAPTPQQQAPKLSDRDNALRLSSNMEELKAAMGKTQIKCYTINENFVFYQNKLVEVVLNITKLDCDRKVKKYNVMS